MGVLKIGSVGMLGDVLLKLNINKLINSECNLVRPSEILLSYSATGADLPLLLSRKKREDIYHDEYASL